MKLGDIMDLAASGLAAQRARVAAAASNLANMNTTRTAEGGAYRRRDPVFVAEAIGGPFGSALDRAVRAVQVRDIAIDPRPPLRELDPSHPDADAEGYVERPRIDVVSELANVMSASRSYEANLVIIRKVREMAEAAAQIGR
jgi:flagellar basal-body rod protein FlgC